MFTEKTLKDGYFDQLLHTGDVTLETYIKARDEAKQTRLHPLEYLFQEKFIAYLLNTGQKVVTHEILSQAKAIYLGAGVAIKKDFEKITPEAISRISAESAREFKIIPIRVGSNNEIVIAALEPLGCCQTFINNHFGRGRVEVIVAPEDLLEQALEKYYPIKPVQSELKMEDNSEIQDTAEEESFVPK